MSDGHNQVSSLVPESNTSKLPSAIRQSSDCDVDPRLILLDPLSFLFTSIADGY